MSNNMTKDVNRVDLAIIGHNRLIGAEDVLSRRNMRLFNLGAMILITIAWAVRFFYFKKREEIVEKEVE